MTGVVYDESLEPAGDDLQSERSRDRILMATAALAKERGLDGTTIAAVCERSGLPVSSVYWHFEDKDALIAEVLRASYTRWLAAVPLWSTPPSLLGRELEQVLEQVIRSLLEVPDYLAVGMQLLLERRDEHEGARMLFVEIRAQIAGMITVWLLEAMQPDPDPVLAEDLARLVVSFSDGALIALQVDPTWDVDAHVRLFLGTFLRGARNRMQRS